MNKISLGALLIVIGIGTAFLMGYISELYYDVIRIEMIDRNNFDFFPYPIIQEDGISVELIHREGISMDDSGAIVLSPDQVKNFEKLNHINAKTVDLQGWPMHRLAISSHDDGSKMLEIYLTSHKNKHKSYTCYEFMDGKLKLISAKRENMVLGRVIYAGCLTSSFIIFGLLLIIIGVIKTIWPTKKKYSFLELPPSFDP
jgi:hypothetical protein